MSENSLNCSVSVRAPAKVNLRLRVLRKRPDGYHDLDSLMFPISLYDDLVIRVSESARASVSCVVTGPERVAAGAENLAAKAAALLLQRFEMRARVRIDLHKRIPFGAGLGGGSSDAAAVLRALPRMLGRRLSRAQAEQLALRLGADVPFFIACRPARASGIGDRLDALRSVPSGAMVVVVPPVRVDTAWAYRTALDGLTSARTVSRLAPLPRRLDAVESWFFNDFGPGVERAVPAVPACRRKLEELGARATVMSGSGSAVVGWFADASVARDAARAFAAPDKAFVATILRRAPRSAPAG